MNTIINTKNAPAAIGPYSQAVKAGDFLFVSGQLPINPQTGLFESSDIKTQTTQALTNLKAIINEGYMELTDAVKVTVYLSDMNNFSDMNSVYERFFTSKFPARVAVEVARLPKDALVEIDAVVHKSL